MILNIKLNNCFAFNNEAIFSMNADMRIKKFPSNLFSCNNLNILKAAVIYGPNNTGKTNFIKSIDCIKSTLSNNKKISFEKNIFNNDNICKVEIKFLENTDIYKYSYWFDSFMDEYIYEDFKKIEIDNYNNENEQIIFLRDTINKKYYSIDNNLESSIKLASKDNILIYTIDVDQNEMLNSIKNTLLKLAEKITVIDMNKIKNSHTISCMKQNDEKSRKIENLIKNADLYLNGYYYKNEDNEFDEDDTLSHYLKDSIKMVSVYKNKEVPSILFDSVGTTKFSAIASYIIEAIENEKIVFIDEIDSSLHFKLTRAIVSLFNNSINTKSQLICTSHDISLLDTKKLFRKDQIWFTDKDEENTKLYSLKGFTANDDGIRDNTDLYDKYSKGFFGAIPEPDLIEGLYNE